MESSPLFLYSDQMLCLCPLEREKVHERKKNHLPGVVFLQERNRPALVIPSLEPEESCPVWEARMTTRTIRLLPSQPSHPTHPPILRTAPPPPTRNPIRVLSPPRKNQTVVVEWRMPTWWQEQLPQVRWLSLVHFLLAPMCNTIILNKILTVCMFPLVLVNRA